MISRLLFSRPWLLWLSIWIAIGGPGTGVMNAWAAEPKPASDQTNCTVVINEFMSARQRVIADEDGDYSDWIELYNCTDQPIHLADWTLSDRHDRPAQWRFPEVSIPAHGYLLVWASGKDKNNLADNQALHTNFRIAASGEPLLLSDAEGVLVDEIPPLVVGEHEAVGRVPDGGDEIAVLTQATPKAPNVKALAPVFVDPPSFSHKAGFYEQDFKLSLEHPDPEVKIYYTLDGSEPDPDNLQGSTYRYKNSYQQPPKEEGQQVVIEDNFLYNEYRTHQYKKPISIRDRRWEPDRISQISTTFDEQPDYFPKGQQRDNLYNQYVVLANKIIDVANQGLGTLNHIRRRLSRKWHKIKTGEVKNLGNKVYYPYFGKLELEGEYSPKGTIVRAIAVKNHSERVVTSEVSSNTYFVGYKNKYNLDVISIMAPENMLYDYTHGFMVAGKLFEDWVSKQNSPIDVNCHRPSNYRHGREVMGKTPASITFFEGSAGKSINVPIKGHGSCSSAARMKSIRLYLDDGLNGTKIFDGHDKNKIRINLRNSGNAFSNDYIRDAVGQNIISGLSIGTQRYEPKVVFINGEYMGILNARDRKDKYYLVDRFNLTADTVDLLKNNNEVDEGDSHHYERFLAQIDTLDTQKNDFLKQVGQNIDLESFIDYFLSSLYLARKDWPGNNIAFWRYTGLEEIDRPTTDGRWRWLAYDLDNSFTNQETNMLEFATKKGGKKWPNPDWSTFVLRTLLKNPDFRQKFITRFADLINTTFEPERVISFIRSAEQGIEKEMPRHIERWQRPKSIKHWRSSIGRMVDFAEQRPAIQRQHLQEYFDLGDLYQLNVDVQQQGNGGLVPVEQAAVISLNTLTLGVSDDELEKPVAASARATNMEKYLAFPWSGEYFAGMPIQIGVTPRPGYRFSHWEGEGIPAARQHESELTLTPEADTSITAVVVKEGG